MQIEKAIEIKEKHLADNAPYDLEELEKADRLGVEALKRVKWHKEQHLDGYYELLPGETKD